MADVPEKPDKIDVCRVLSAPCQDPAPDPWHRSAARGENGVGRQKKNPLRWNFGTIWPLKALILLAFERSTGYLLPIRLSRNSEARTALPAQL